MNIDVKKILDQAKDSYDRYFKDAPQLPENHGQDVVFDKEKMKGIINKKVNQLEGHVNNLNTLKKELEGESATVLNNTFSKDKEEYTKTTVNQMLKDYEEERKRIDDLKKKLDEIKK
jgi:predicted RNase H-like nuclease (RuvC/YqgF family)